MIINSVDVNQCHILRNLDISVNKTAKDNEA